MRRATKLVGLSTQATAVCRDVALRVGGILDLGDEVRQALGQCDEHWNGKSGVLGLKGEQISVHARLFRLAQDIDVFHRSGRAAGSASRERVEHSLRTGVRTYTSVLILTVGCVAGRCRDCRPPRSLIRRTIRCRCRGVPGATSRLRASLGCRCVWVGCRAVVPLQHGISEALCG